MYSYFKRGLTIYWHDSAAIVKQAHTAALDARRRGFPDPSEIDTSALHPSRMGFAWRINNPQEMG